MNWKRLAWIAGWLAGLVTIAFVGGAYGLHWLGLA
jgi:hypothetical protein